MRPNRSLIGRVFTTAVVSFNIREFIGSLSNDNGDGNENVTNLHI